MSRTRPQAPRGRPPNPSGSDPSSGGSSEGASPGQSTWAQSEASRPQTEPAVRAACLAYGSQADDDTHPTGNEPPADTASALHSARIDRLMGTLMGTLERDIIPRLVQAHAGAPAPMSPTPPGPDDVAAFTSALLAHEHAAIDRLLGALKARGISTETTFIHLLGPAARRLGELWEEDRCHFAEVTIGVGRLQQIMRGLSSALGTEIDSPAGGHRALLIPAPGEQHTFGLSMVAEIFARAGWDVSGMLDPEATGFQDRVAHEWFDLVGVSAGSTTRLEGVVSCVEAIRQRSHNRAVMVMVGGPLFMLHPELAQRVPADAVVVDGQDAPRVAEQWLGRRAKQR